MKHDKPEKVKKSCPANVGGQALMEGILMRCPQRDAFVVRRPDGGMVIEVKDNPAYGKPAAINKIPVLRGIVNFIKTIKVGYGALNRSFEIALPEDEEADEAQKKKDKSAGQFAVVIGSVLGIVLAVFLMIFLPTWLTRLLQRLTDTQFANWLVSLLEGVFKLLVFLGYLAVCTLNKEVRRLFMYHGAEHKTIFCYEKGLPLTVENVKKQSRFHPRCGTSFIVLMIAVSILIFAFVPSKYAFLPDGIAQTLFRSLLKLAMLPLVMGVGYELLKLCGKYDNVLTRIIAAPGLLFQRLATKEPDDDGILEVGIASLEAALQLEITVPTEPAKPAEPETPEPPQESAPDHA